MEILVIPTTDWTGQLIPTRLHHIFERIAENHNVHVLHFKLYPDRKVKSSVILDEMNDSRVPNLALYYLFNAPRHFGVVSRILKENHIDVVVVSNLLSGYMAMKAIEGRAKLVFDLSDHFPTSGAGYYFNVNSGVGVSATLVLEKLLKSMLARADSTITCSQTLSDYAKSLNAKNVHMISNGVDGFFFNSFDGQKVKDALNLTKTVTIGHVGTVEFWLDIFPLVKAVKSLSERYDVKLLMVGKRPNAKFAKFVDRVTKELHAEDCIMWHDAVPYLEVPNYISAMDMCTIPFNSSHPTAFYSAPIKLLEYFALGRPVISSPIPNVLSLASQYVDVATTADDYVRIIENYIQNPEVYLEKARHGREIAKQMTWDNLAKEYEEFLERTVSA